MVFPISKESMPSHTTAARDAILNYIHETGNTDFVTGKQIFLQGSPELDTYQWDSNRTVVGHSSTLCAQLFTTKPHAKLGNQLYRRLGNQS